jgi:hypothetical protein
MSAFQSPQLSALSADQPVVSAMSSEDCASSAA